MKKSLRFTALLMGLLVSASCLPTMVSAAARTYSAGMALRAVSGGLIEETNESTVDVILQLKGTHLEGAAGLVLWYDTNVLELIPDSAAVASKNQFEEPWTTIGAQPLVEDLGGGFISILAQTESAVGYDALTDVVRFSMIVENNSLLGPDVIAIASTKSPSMLNHAAVMSFDYRVVVSNKSAPDGLSVIVPELKYLVNASLSLAAEQAGYSVKTVAGADTGGDSGGNEDSGGSGDSGGDSTTPSAPSAPAPEKTEIQVSGIAEQTKPSELAAKLEDALKEIAKDQVGGSGGSGDSGGSEPTPEIQQTVQVVDASGEKLEDGNNVVVGTGAKVQLIQTDENGDVVLDENEKPIVIEEVVIVIKGDVGGDGKIEEDDALDALNHSASYKTVDESYQENACDYNNDGHVSMDDALNIYRHSNTPTQNGGNA